MKIKWYGTASLLLESGGSRILIDPYLRPLGKKVPPMSVEEARKADAIFITHAHLDHFADIDAFTKEGGVREVYLSRGGIAVAQRNGHDTACMRPIEGNGAYHVGPFTVKTYQSRHCRFDAATLLRIAFSPRTWVHPVKAVKLLRGMKRYKIADDDIYALQISDGDTSVMVLGSAAIDEKTAYPQGADLLVFPYQGRAHMHRYLVPFLQVFRPKAVMLDHFDNAFPPFTHTVKQNKFAPTLQEHLPAARAIIPAEGEWIEFNDKFF